MGWAFPPEAVTTSRFEWRSGAVLVRQSILIILDTEPGERVMRPDFGCGLRRYLMEPNTPATRAAIARDIEAALGIWEPRIVVGAVDVTPTAAGAWGARGPRRGVRRAWSPSAATRSPANPPRSARGRR